MALGEGVRVSLLPPPPPAVPADLTRATARYKRHAWLALVGLLGFVLVYFALTGFCWTSYRLFADLFAGGPGGFFAFVGGALSGLLGAFLLSALFFVKSGGAPTDLEVTAEQEPELFRFLYALADRVRAPRPHRVFLSMRVNAAVFYDLKLINLLLPSKKNLEIGLGLVNTLNLSEMTAVLAHEFGHFAQRSMAVGRWVSSGSCSGLEAELFKLPAELQASACVMALVRAGEKAPAPCRALATWYLFAAERPYFR
jgi:Zn-dependent protease with chaperone function